MSLKADMGVPVADERDNILLERLASLIDDIAGHVRAWADLEIVRSGLHTIFGPESLDRAGSAIVAAVVIAFLFVIPRS